MKSVQERVVCATNDKTVAVEVVRLTPYPKYKRRVRKKKKYPAHDPENRFKVGDLVRLRRSSPISQTKTFIAIPVQTKGSGNSKAFEEAEASGELGIPLEPHQQA